MEEFGKLLYLQLKCDFIVVLDEDRVHCSDTRKNVDLIRTGHCTAAIRGLKLGVLKTTILFQQLPDKARSNQRKAILQLHPLYAIVRFGKYATASLCPKIDNESLKIG